MHSPSRNSSVAARTVALFENQSSEMAENSFLAGMLHDVGKAVFATRAPRRMFPREEATAQMDAHHAEVGAYLLGLWGFPNAIVRIRSHRIQALYSNRPWQTLYISFCRDFEELTEWQLLTPYAPR